QPARGVGRRRETRRRASFRAGQPHGGRGCKGRWTHTSLPRRRNGMGHRLSFLARSPGFKNIPCVLAALAGEGAGPNAREAEESVAEIPLAGKAATVSDGLEGQVCLA